jgi:serine/threonine protein kinase/Tol biopolymer transport system component
MTEEHWHQVEDLYRAVCTADVRERLDVLAGADPDVRREVESLLAHCRDSGPLDHRAIDLLGGTVATLARPSVATSLSPGTTIGPYTISGTLGAGGMGVVYRAQDKRLGREVAIKLLIDIAADDERRERFRREARAIARLTHRHIRALYDIGHEVARSDRSEVAVDFLIMEYVDGETLAKRLKRGPLPLPQALQYGIEIADALEEAHRQGVVHRDLKPANIMVTSSGVKLLDFGLAKLEALATDGCDRVKALTGGVNVTEPGTILGTLRYMAPEQLDGRDIDGRADIFAFGVLLYEMITGRQAFDAPNQFRVIASILEHEPTPIAEVQPLCPSPLAHVVHGCLSKSPDDRWQSARDIVKQLKWIASGASPTGPSISASRYPRRRIAWLVVACLSVVLLVVSALAWRYRAASNEGGAARFDVVTPDMPAPTFMSISPDGRHIAFVALGPAGVPVLFVRSIDSAEARPLSGTDHAMLPFWSADSRYIGFAAHGQLKRIDPSGGPPLTLCDVADFYGGTWNADGVILFSAGRAPVMRVPASGGTPEAVTELDQRRGEQGHLWPYFLPDGRRFLYLRAGQELDNRAIYIASLDSTDDVKLVQANTRPMYASGYLLFNRESTLFAQRLDVNRLALTGESIRIADGMFFSAPVAAAAYAVSAAGTLIYRAAASRELAQLVWYDRLGNAIDTVGTPGIYRSVALSPDNRRIAIHVHQEPEGGDVWIVDRERGTFTRLNATGHNSSPLWSHDGESVFFSSGRGNNPLVLFRKTASGVGREEVVRKGERAIYSDDITADGRSLIYRQRGGPDGAFDIWSLALDDREQQPRPIVGTRFGERMAKLSPDARWIAYESNESGRFEIYVQPYLHSTGRWQISTDGGRYARWARNGSELFYLKNDGTLMAVHVNAARSTFEASTAQPLFNGNPVLADHVNTSGATFDIPYDVTADGQRFLFTRRVANEIQGIPISVVLNWSATLQN